MLRCIVPDALPPLALPPPQRKIEQLTEEVSAYKEALAEKEREAAAQVKAVERLLAEERKVRQLEAERAAADAATQAERSAALEQALRGAQQETVAERQQLRATRVRRGRTRPRVPLCVRVFLSSSHRVCCLVSFALPPPLARSWSCRSAGLT